MDSWINRPFSDPQDPAKKIITKTGLTIHYSTSLKKWQANYGNYSKNSPSGDTLEEALEALKKKFDL